MNPLIPVIAILLLGTGITGMLMGIFHQSSRYGLIGAILGTLAPITVFILTGFIYDHILLLLILPAIAEWVFWALIKYR